MAQSVQYKNVYPNDTTLDNAISTAENITGDLQSKANKYVNNTTIDNAISTAENITGDLQSKANKYTKDIL